ncbi:hypothetical protein OIDMADRAFT_178026 [Oidiodendron maius Zn]|uniref:Uncharacterized protein n=1 Tax=Oidiodendron maius (strain Zn) TaxID=913774 RepID=A0A0C3HLN6_OIDMZ|nr:hypothetical protein OIDMADRAFT_178026 [Oidiodendron maius Zn]
MEISDDNWVEVPTRRGAWSSVEVEVAMEERRVVGYEELPGELEVEGDAEVAPHSHSRQRGHDVAATNGPGAPGRGRNEPTAALQTFCMLAFPSVDVEGPAQEPHQDASWKGGAIVPYGLPLIV